MPSAVRATTSTPARPVNVLELPELTTIARALPRFSAALHQSTGAPRVFDLVNTPAIVVPGSSSATIRSRRSLYRMPQCALASATPAIGGSAGWLGGASGDGVGMANTAPYFLSF